jgi:hypothetical protein
MTPHSRYFNFSKDTFRAGRRNECSRMQENRQLHDEAIQGMIVPHGQQRPAMEALSSPPPVPFRREVIIDIIG